MKTVISKKKPMKSEDRNDAVSQSRRLVSAREMSRLAKGDNSVFLAIVRATNEVSPKRKSNKQSSAHAARFAAAHGMSKGTRRSINKSQGPKKDIISVAERER